MLKLSVSHNLNLANVMGPYFGYLAVLLYIFKENISPLLPYS